MSNGVANLATLAKVFLSRSKVYMACALFIVQTSADLCPYMLKFGMLTAHCMLVYTTKDVYKTWTTHNC